MARLMTMFVLLMFSLQTLCVATERLCIHHAQSNQITTAVFHSPEQVNQLDRDSSTMINALIDASAHDDSGSGCDCGTCHHHLSFVPVLFAVQVTAITYTDYLWPAYSLPLLAEHASTLYRPPNHL